MYDNVTPLRVGDLCLLIKNDSGNSYLQETFKPGCQVQVIEIRTDETYGRHYRIANTNGVTAKTVRRNLIKISPDPGVDYYEDVVENTLTTEV